MLLLTSQVIVSVPTLPPPPETCLGAVTGEVSGVCIVTERRKMTSLITRGDSPILKHFYFIYKFLIIRLSLQNIFYL